MQIGPSAIQLPIPDSAHLEVVNYGPFTVYYGNYDVSSTKNLGSIPPKGRWIFNDSNYLVSPSGMSTVLLVPTLVLNSQATGVLSLRQDFALNPSMAPESLHTKINEAIQSAISAGQALTFGSETWPIEGGALLVNGPLTLVGQGVFEQWGKHSVANTWVPVSVSGAGIEQLSEGANGIEVPIEGQTAHLRDFLVRFGGSAKWTNTGHGIIALPGTYLTGLDHGIFSPHWRDLLVYGHDGNHYAYSKTNCIYGQFDHLHAFGGGGLQLNNNSTTYKYGNGVYTRCFMNTIVGGSAHCYMLEGNEALTTALNLLTFLGCQGWVASTGFAGIPAPPTNAQLLVKAKPAATLVETVDWLQPDQETNVNAEVEWPVKANAIMGGQITPSANKPIQENPTNETWYRNESGFAVLYTIAVKFEPEAGAAATLDVQVNPKKAEEAGSQHPLGKPPTCPTIPATGLTGTINSYSFVVPTGAYFRWVGVKAKREWSATQPLVGGR